MLLKVFQPIFLRVLAWDWEAKRLLLQSDVGSRDILHEEASVVVMSLRIGAIKSSTTSW